LEHHDLGTFEERSKKCHAQEWLQSLLNMNYTSATPIKQKIKHDPKMILAHFGITLGSFRHHFGIIFTSFWDNFRIVWDQSKRRKSAHSHRKQIAHEVNFHHTCLNTKRLLYRTYSIHRSACGERSGQYSADVHTFFRYERVM